VTKTILAIAGASASGKTFFTQTIYRELLKEIPDADLAVIEEDAYYHEQSQIPFKQREKINYDHPNAFDHELLFAHLRALRNGDSIDVPIYDFAEHNRAPYPKIRHVENAEIIIVEGILLLHDPVLRDEFDIKVFIETPLDICLLRRLQRDIRERGRSIESVAEQYQNTVRPMFYDYIEPSKQFADLTISGNQDNRAGIELIKQNIKASLFF